MKRTVLFRLIVLLAIIIPVADVSAKVVRDSTVTPNGDPGPPVPPIGPIQPDTTIFTPIDGGEFQARDFPTIDPSDPEIPTVNSNYAVGATKGALSVNGMGATEYSLPIKCPDGGGLTPQVNLVYNSQNAGYGLAGYGFTVSGCSSITRGKKTLFSNGSTAGVTYTASDDLFLDGKRLILLTGSACQEGATYCLEGDPYTKITAHGTYSGNTATTWFEVKTADGHTMQYGNSVDARIIYYNNAIKLRIASWYINRTEDIHGNYITYNYTISQLYAYLNKITYAKNKYQDRGITNEITFNYDTIAANSTTFMVEDQRGKIQYCISSITTSCNDSIYRTYQLNYDHTTDGSSCKFSRLTEVREMNAIGESLMPVTFTWSYLPGNGITYSSIAVTTESTNYSVEDLSKSFLSVDFNGDGIGDVIRISPVKIATGTGSWTYETRIYVNKSTIDGNGDVNYDTQLVFEIPASLSLGNIKTALGGASYTDFDGDGLFDLVLPYQNEVTDQWNETMFFLLRGRDVVANRSGQLPFYVVNVVSDDDIPLVVAADFDGNGKDEIVSVEKKKHENSYRCSISQLTNANSLNFTNMSLTLPSGIDEDIVKLFAGDYNNDLLPDLILLYDSGYKVYFNNGGNDVNNLFSETNVKTGTSMNDRWHMQQGDIDGDGLLDFVSFENCDNKLRLYRNNGNGTFSTSYVSLNGNLFSLGCDECSLMVWDMDHDGRSDVMICNKSNNTNQIRWFYSNGSTLIPAASIDKSSGDDCKEPYIFLGDFNGDGNIELANYGSNLRSADNTVQENRLIVYATAATSAQNGRITSITDGMAETTNLSYELATRPSVYTRTSPTNNTFPVNTYTLPFALVKQIQQSNGVAATQTVEYSYKDFKLHMQGAGALGFDEVTKRNLTSGEQTTITIKERDPVKYIPTETATITSIDNRTSTTTSQTQVANVGITFYAYESRTEIQDFDGNTAVTTSSYDVSRGVLTCQRVENDGSDMFKEVSYTDYVNKSDMWLPGKTIMTQKHADDANSHSTTTQYTYDNKGNVLTKVERAGTSMALTTTATYDVYGNCTSTAATGTGVTPITRYAKYDSSGRFITKKYQSPATTITTATYDVWGNMLTQSDITNPANTLTTTNTYDRWSRLTLSISPDSIETTHLTGWGRNNNKRYYVMSQRENKPWTLTWYDNAGHEVQSETFGQNNLRLSKFTTYNDLGQVSRVKSYEGVFITTRDYTYDELGRVISDRLSTDSETTYSYGNRVVTATSAGRSYTKTTDAWGNLISVVDPMGNEVTYTYSSVGKPISISTNGATISKTYDDAGNAIAMTDPDAGTTTYEYAADGTLLSQTDAKGVETTNTYDALGRLSAVSIGNNTITNTYGTSGNELLRLTKKSMNGNSIEYTHDNFGRVVAEKRTVAGKGEYSYSYQYNSKNQLSKVVYPGGLEVEYYYDNYGFTTGVTADDKNVFAHGYYDGFTNRCSFMGKLHSTWRRDSLGFEKNRQISRITNHSVIDNIDVKFDNVTANLLSRQRRNSAKESFSYDILDRLTGISVGEEATMNIGYATNGNITSKTGVGSYSYNSSLRQHAVMSVTNPDGLIPSEALITEFNDFNKIQYIEDEGTDMTMDFVYGPDLQRWYTEVADSGVVVKSTIYAGDYEKVTLNGVTREFYYLDGGVIVIKQNDEFTPYLAFKDHLGSILSIVDENGTKVFDASYDAWGMQTIMLNTIGLQRGYTGHEMLSEFGIINMNGRLYDPMLGRFFSPDNYVQETENSQNFNRYSYCLNNPLKYTDPSGELFGIDDAVIAFAVFNLASSMMQAAFNGENVLKAGALSLLSSAASFGIGQLFGSIGGVGRELLRAGAHGLAGGFVGALGGGDFGQSFITGFISSAVGSATSALKLNASLTIATSALTGGVTAWITGQDFVKGALQGMTVSMMNHALHDVVIGACRVEVTKKIARSLIESNPELKEKIINAIQEDGKLSFGEAYFWYGCGDGTGINVDASKMDLGTIDVTGRKINDSWHILTLSVDNVSEQGLVYGSITVTYKGNGVFVISPDEYNFEMHNWKRDEIFRNIQTFGAGLLHGSGTKFKIRFNGVYKNK